MFRVLKLLLIFCFVTVSNPIFSRGSGGHSSYVHIKGHTTKKGQYISPHNRMAPNKNKNDNWSHKGNINPFTGKKGTKK